MKQTQYKKKITVRDITIIGLVVIAFLLLTARFAYIQVIRHDDYAELAERQYERKQIIQAERGEIFDRHKSVLAFNQNRYSFDIYKPAIKGKHGFVSGTFSKATGKSKSYYLKKLQKKSQYIQMARNLTETAAESIFKKNLNGLRHFRQYARYYPLQNIGSHIIGFCGVESKGLEGTEKYYDAILGGKDGERFIFADAHNYGRVRTDFPEILPEKGLDITLTIQLSFQTVLEEELSRVKKAHLAKSAMAVLVDIRNGDILAMASLPNYNPNDPTSISKEAMRNRCISDMFDPGSIFKPITAAALLQEGKAYPGKKVFCENGKYELYDITIHDHEPYGDMTFEEVMIKSSNIGIIKLASELDSETMFRYIRAFGFGERSGIELPGEGKGILSLPANWSGVTKASLAMGHEIAVTPLQMAMAYAALANGGILYKPHVIYQIEGQEVREVEKIRRVFNSDVSETLNQILREVVIEGTGKKAFLEYTAIAGKTGTAQKIDIKTGKYSHESYVASFAGYFPANDPRYAMVIMVDSPNRNGFYGGQVAAPVFRMIVQRIIGLPTGPQYVRRGSRELSSDSLVYIPDMVGISSIQAAKILADYGFNTEVQGDFPMVVEQYPAKGQKVPRELAGNIILVCNSDYGRNFKMPDLKGKLMREAIYDLKLQGVLVNVTGAGRVKTQWPEPGTAIALGQKVRIKGEQI